MAAGSSASPRMADLFLMLLKYQKKSCKKFPLPIWSIAAILDMSLNENTGDVFVGNIVILPAMKLDKAILAEIKMRVIKAEPDAKIILYGSYARGDANEESDIDLLILVDKEKITYQDQVRITDPLYSFGLETTKIISALVQTKDNWEQKYYYTPLYHNIKKEGKEI